MLENYSFNNKNTINIGQIKSMLDEIDTMTPEEQHFIAQILKKSDTKYMENDNGIFVKLNQLNLDTILEIHNYVDQIRSNKKNIETAIRSVDSNIHNNSIVNNHQNIDSNDSSSHIQIENWKKDIIEKMRESKNNKKKRKQNNKNPN